MLDTSIYQEVGKNNVMQGLADAVGNYYKQKNEQADRANRLADLAQQRELQGIQLAQAREGMTPEAVAMRQQQAAMKQQELEANYMRGVNAEIASNPEGKDAILEKHAAIAPKVGINPEHFTWLAADLSKAQTPEELQQRALYHSLPADKQAELLLKQQKTDEVFQHIQGADGKIYGVTKTGKVIPLMADGQPIAGEVKPQAAPTTRTIHQGQNQVSQEWDAATKTWKTVGVGIPTSASSPKKPLPTTALKMQNELTDAIGTSSSINADLTAFENKIDKGELKLGPVENITSELRNKAGSATPNSANYASFKSTLERLRNESLRLNKGVQTEGDAQRIWNELIANINDPMVVKQRLGEIKALNARAIELRKLDIDNVRANYGHDPLDVSGYTKVGSAISGGKAPPTIPKTGGVIKYDAQGNRIGG